MREVVVAEFGPPEVMQVHEVSDPTPGPQEALVDVEFADVGTLDRLVRSGWGREHFGVLPPYVPGNGVGGVIRAVGADIDQTWVGRQVVGGTGPRGADGMSTAPTGGYADRALVDARSMMPVPDELSLETATALLNDGPTSRMLLDTTEPGPADTVLVLSAAGAGGMLVAQAAGARGAIVVAAARGDAKVRALRTLGVEHVVDYSDDDWTDQVRQVAPQGVSVIFDGAGGTLGHDGIGLVAEGGRIVSYGSSAGEFANPDIDLLARRGVTFKGLFDLPKQTTESRKQLLSRAFMAAADGEARPMVTLIPLADAPRAHRALEERTAVGKTLLSR